MIISNYNWKCRNISRDIVDDFDKYVILLVKMGSNSLMATEIERNMSDFSLCLLMAWYYWVQEHLREQSCLNLNIDYNTWVSPSYCTLQLLFSRCRIGN